jgi:hypothetical protein
MESSLFVVVFVNLRKAEGKSNEAGDVHQPDEPVPDARFTNRDEACL